jgi:hypothetical protein
MSRSKSEPQRSPMPAMKSLLRLCCAAAAAGLWSSGAAWAQSQLGAKGEAAHAEWRRLTQTEVNCVDRGLRTQGTTLWIMIQRGVRPSDPAAARVRAGCRMQAQTPNPAPQSAAQALASAPDTAAKKADAERVATEKAEADKTQATKLAAEKAEAERTKAAAEKVAAEKAEANRMAAAKAATDQAEAERASAARVEADRWAAERAAVELAKANPERVPAETVKPRVKTERSLGETDSERPETLPFHSAAELRMSFIYGLISGPLLFTLGGFVFLLMHRKRMAPPLASRTGEDNLAEIHRLVKVVLADQTRREKASADHSQPERAKPAEAQTAAVH